jgi:hypothetical protein
MTKVANAIKNALGAVDTVAHVRWLIYHRI